MLNTLYPALIKFAEAELRAAGLNEQEAADVVQDACERWIKTSPAYLREAITGLVFNLHREGADASTHHPLSLDSQIEEL